MDENRSGADSLMIGLVVIALLLLGVGGFVLFQRQTVMQRELENAQIHAVKAMHAAEIERMKAKEQEARAEKALQEAEPQRVED